MRKNIYQILITVKAAGYVPMNVQRTAINMVLEAKLMNRNNMTAVEGFLYSGPGMR